MRSGVQICTNVIANRNRFRKKVFSVSSTKHLMINTSKILIKYLPADVKTSRLQTYNSFVFSKETLLLLTFSIKTNLKNVVIYLPKKQYRNNCN